MWVYFLNRRLRDPSKPFASREDAIADAKKKGALYCVLSEVEDFDFIPNLPTAEEYVEQLRNESHRLPKMYIEALNEISQEEMEALDLSIKKHREATIDIMLAWIHKLAPQIYKMIGETEEVDLFDVNDPFANDGPEWDVVP
jgi:hypothetical protein